METVLWIAFAIGFFVLLFAIAAKISPSRGYLGAKKTPGQYIDESDIRLRR
jgi:hypothetical protein